jgi:hypothetical protein
VFSEADAGTDAGASAGGGDEGDGFEESLCSCSGGWGSGLLICTKHSEQIG